MRVDALAWIQDSFGPSHITAVVSKHQEAITIFLVPVLAPVLARRSSCSSESACRCAGRRRRPGRQAIPVAIACELGAQHPRLQGQRQRRGVGREAQQKGPSASALRAVWLPGRQQGALRPFSHLLALVQLITALYCIDITLILSATSHCSGGSKIIFCSQRSASSFVQSQQPKSILA